MVTYTYIRPADSYHTLYCLSGLSIAQHHVYPSDAKRKGLETIWTPREGDDRRRDALRRTVFANALCWREEEGVSVVVGGNANRVVSNPALCLTLFSPLPSLSLSLSLFPCAYFFFSI